MVKRCGGRGFEPGFSCKRDLEKASVRGRKLRRRTFGSRNPPPGAKGSPQGALCRNGQGPEGRRSGGNPGRRERSDLLATPERCGDGRYRHPQASLLELPALPRRDGKEALRRVDCIGKNQIRECAE